MESFYGKKTYLLTGAQMSAADRYTSETIGIPSLVLMERAALAVAQKVAELLPRPAAVTVFTGRGNNGADGLAAARLLAERGYPVRVFVLPGEERGGSALQIQQKILARLGIAAETFSEDKARESREAVVVDALFGTGLSRPLTGAALAAVQVINEKKNGACAPDTALGDGTCAGVRASVVGMCASANASAVDTCAPDMVSAAYASVPSAASSAAPRVVSVDLPSGISADDGSVQGAAVRADATVTFAFYKRGHFLYPGTSHCGALTLAQIGIGAASLTEEPALFTLRGARGLLPPREPAGHKGTFGKALVIAGSRNMAGAALLSGRGAFAGGAGMVRIETAECNRVIVQTALPEAMLTTYEDEGEQAAVSSPSQGHIALCENGQAAGDMASQKTGQAAKPFGELRARTLSALCWADGAVVGPGLGRSKTARALLRLVLEQMQQGSALLRERESALSAKDSALPKPLYRLVIDADALRLLAEDESLRALLRGRDGRVTCLLTPHMGEAAALAGQPMAVCQGDRFETARRLADGLNVCVALKDARTVVCAPGRREQYLNTSGNSGMATAGSGDVLTGLALALLLGRDDPFEAAVLAVYLHGRSGDLAAARLGEDGVTAGAIAEAVPEAMRTARL